MNDDINNNENESQLNSQDGSLLRKKLSFVSSFADMVLFNFHEFDFRTKKNFILAPCGHAFHTYCLETWLKQKRECPTDRKPLDIGLND
jgi:hypothetical protein